MYFRPIRSILSSLFLLASIQIYPSLFAHAANSPIIQEFAAPLKSEKLKNIAASPDGNIWFLESNSNKVGRITPTGIISEFPVQAPLINASDMTFGADGNLWIAIDNILIRVTQKGIENNFPLASDSYVTGIAAGPDGNIWFLTNNPQLKNKSEQLGRITPEGKITTFSFPDTSSVYKPYGWATYLTAGPNGTLWVAEPGTNKIGRLTTQGQMTEFTVPSAPPDPVSIYGYDQPLGSEPSLITWGPDNNLWFLERNGNKLGRITPTGVFSEFPLNINISSVSSMVFGSDGNLWMTNSNSIIRVTQQGTTDVYPMKNYSAIAYITRGPDGNLWFTDEFRDEIGRIVLTNKSSRT